MFYYSPPSDRLTCRVAFYEITRTLTFLKYRILQSKISSGLQYMVFDAGSGRVAKIERPIVSQLYQIFKWYGWISRSKLSVLHKVNNDRASVSRLITQINCENLSSRFANPSVVRHGYFQDKCIVLDDLLSCSEYVERKALLTKVNSSILSHWQLGFIDKSFNYHLNFGLNSTGDAVCLDLGELTASLDEVVAIRKDNTWRKKAFWRHLDESEAVIFDEQMKKLMSQKIVT